MSRTPEDLISFTQRALARLRGNPPLVQCITNSVVTNVTANALLAIGASPAMVDIPDEADAFARVASGLLVNLGTPTTEQREAAIEATAAAVDVGTPWVLDPVAVGVLPVRTALAHRLVDAGPTIIRGNASEILALAGAGGGGRGTDSTDEVDAAGEHARGLAIASGAVVAISGPVDLISDGRRTIRVGNGHPLLTRITGGGCALGAVMAAFASLDDDRLATTAAATAVYGVAAEIAAVRSAGPGSFAVAFIDALASVDAEVIAERASFL
ncbi:hydroxyethylthiazole kinase [Okibacterium endophyticum]